jgi:hypothetical protein
MMISLSMEISFLEMATVMVMVTAMVMRMMMMTTKKIKTL